MADEFQKKILFTAESKLGTVKEDLLDLNKTLDEQLTKQRLLELQGKRNTEQYIETASQVRLTKQSIRDTNREFDNAVKAINATSNSVQQNRALVSTLTAEYIKLSQTEGATAASTLKLKDNIDQLTTTLKSQEKAIGQNNRNVGNYANDIQSALSQITGAIPGFQQFGAAGQAVVKVVGGFLPSAISKVGNSFNNFIGNPGRNVIQGFGKMEQSAATATKEVEGVGESLVTITPAAGEASAGLEAVGAGAGIAGGAIAALVAIIAGAVYYISTLGSVGLKAAQVFDGVKASFLAFADDIAKGDMKTLGKDMQDAYKNAVDLKKGMQQLDRTKDQSDITVAQYDREIAANMMALRYKKITLAEARQIDKETEKLEDDRVKLKEENARKEYAIVVGGAINSKKVRDNEKKQILDQLYSGKLELIQNLEINDKIMAGTSKKLKDIEMQVVSAQQEADLSEQKSKNRQALIEQRFAKQGAKFADMQTKELAQANANIRQAEEAKILSIARQMEFTMSAFGKELAATDLHYQTLIFKEQQFVAEQEKLAKLAKSQAAKQKFLEAKDKGMLAIKQFQSEWDADIQQHYKNNSETMLDLLNKSQDELRKVAITNIKDIEEKQIETLKLDQDIKTQAYEKKKTDREKQIAELKADAEEASGDRRAQLLKDATDLENIQKNADKQQIDQVRQTAEAKAKVKLDAANKEKVTNTESDVLKAKFNDINDPSNSNDKTLLDAQLAQLTIQREAELSNESLTAAEKKKINQKYLNDVQALYQPYYNKRLQKAKEWEELIQTQASTIIKNAVSSQSEYTQVNLEKSKTFELNNQALTTTQKAVINEKYRIQEGKAKQKEFKTNQELSIAEAIINGAVAMLKIDAQTGVLGFAFDIKQAAETALLVASIAAQKPPAYADGGLHYKSDGRGSLLRGPGTGTSDSMNARLSNGESIINAKSTQMFAPWLSAINQAGGGRPFDVATPLTSWFPPGFASGGLAGYLPTSDNGLRPQLAGGNNSRIHPTDIDSIVSGIVSGINLGISNLPRPIADIKDVNHAQGLLTNVQDRANY